nr:hypothetical protein GCM10010200_035090 [Actinomadura rugatobispora]
MDGLPKTPSGKVRRRLLCAARTVLTEQEGPLRRLILNRPERRNAMDGELVRTLRKAVRAAIGDPRTRVLASAAGFCAGADPRHLLAIERNGGRPVDFLAEVSACVTELARCPKPVMAALHRHAVAGGIELAPACDIVIASSATGSCPQPHRASGCPAGSVAHPDRHPYRPNGSRTRDGCTRWMCVTRPERPPPN